MNFRKKFETALGPIGIIRAGAWGKLIHEKTRSKNSRDTVPLKLLLHKPSVREKTSQVEIHCNTLESKFFADSDLHYMTIEFYFVA
jgi:hypothetical protein